MAKPFNFADHLPEDALMRQAWLDCLHWAVGEADILARFRVETGNNWEPGTTPEKILIDQATGAGRAFFEAFVPWLNTSVWGDVQ
ncbi:hypothetical protein P7L87_26180 [Vibrio parahaemolyticus]|nr:hypothetical protein [Vibrio parahaemolyticus]